MPPELLDERRQGLNAESIESKEKTLRSSQFNLTNESLSGSIIIINQIPILNVFDLTRTSHNMRRLRQGNLHHPEDLESEIVPDDKIKELDLAVIEKEMNKKKLKRAKAQQNGKMFSPLASARPTENQRNRRRQFPDEDDDDIE